MNKRNELPDERQDNRDDTANERAYEALEITITVFVNEDVITASINAIASADVLIIGGTSLVVYPAAGLVRYFNGSKLVICNLQPTPQDSWADLVCACDIAKAFDF